MNGASLSPNVGQGLREELGEIVDVGGTDKVSLVTLGLERLLGWVFVVNRLQVERSLVTDGLEDAATLVGADLLVAVEVDNESRDVLDHATNGCDIAFPILQDDTNLRASDVESPETLAVSLNEARNGGEDIIVSNWEVVDEVHEDVVGVGISLLRADELKRIENVRD